MDGKEAYEHFKLGREEGHIAGLKEALEIMADGAVNYEIAVEVAACHPDYLKRHLAEKQFGIAP